MVQACAIPPPLWGLLSQWHRQETATPETNGASSAQTKQHSQEILRFIGRQISYYIRKVSKLYCSYNSFNQNDSICSHWILDKILLKNRDRKNYTSEWNLYITLLLHIIAPGPALWWFEIYQNHLPSRLPWRIWTWPICQVWKPAILLSLIWFSTYQNPLPCCLSWQNWTRHICQVCRVSKTAVLMMILNLSESLAKPLVMAKLNMAYLSSLINQQNCCRWDDFKLIRTHTKQFVMAKLNMAYLSS